MQTLKYSLSELLSAELKPRGYDLEHFWQADLGYIWAAKFLESLVSDSN